MIVRPLVLRDPMDAVRRLKGLANLTFLDSAMSHPTLGRFSFVAADPFGSFVVDGGRVTWNGAPVDLPGEAAEPLGRRALAALKARLALYRQPSVPGLPPFQGGAAGYLAYDFGRLLERLPEPAVAQGGVPALQLHFYDVVLSWDHRENRVWLVSTGWPEADPVRRDLRAARRADEVEALLAAPPSADEGAATAELSWRSNVTRAEFEAAVARTREYILAGDIFQANIAQRFAATLPAGFDPLAFYAERLRRVNKATFAAYLDYGALKVASSSPERFAQVYDGRVETRPIKGTIRRSAHPAEDMHLSAVLAASEKDRAENVMIVDLLRNDLSRVCRPHTVHVPQLNGLESYATVHHLVSVVSGALKDGLDAVDLLAAAFPGGSITGAPKIRAMEIITELERIERGVYCGSIGYFGFDGAADTNIAIRTVSFVGGEAIVWAGGGMTALSNPADEYDETIVKARRVLEAFRPEEGAR
ncbi:aminodeoxychorismate synthase component I [Oharaeibacter diazotrophicus]|uniref:aminodeoxychorismate synthase n=1 Tax=Oharaeibacter diazotrophicus TaxID=1920512 RepID=A0A4R6RJR7_9HYPH|nr:aminodeoxychorismate synthase component I [Oharaeibacter diazotrophicus]TDP86684.1 para-aminobenzoate synthetase component 1 [Oharaeibacter diazotrophicus]BBE71374.1 aminodeoxychorismate synthase component 1 [Pleomorphomonas sp. SM30]GLS78130.1 aminodeoxychorismate synthase, component I [Oharaeibacter diazotrophicus]